MYYRGDNDWLDYQRIQHWKYIKREWKNGKYRYYYKDDDFDAIAKKREQARLDHEEAKEHSQKMRKFVTYYTFQLDEKNGGDKSKTDNDPHLQGWKDYAKKVSDEVSTTYKKYKDIDKTYQRAVKAYNASAGHKIADILEKSEDKIRKGAKWVKNLFG